MRCDGKPAALSTKILPTVYPQFGEPVEARFSSKKEKHNSLNELFSQSTDRDRVDGPRIRGI